MLTNGWRKGWSVHKLFSFDEPTFWFPQSAIKVEREKVKILYLGYIFKIN
jgi:hypothetical protein